MANDWREMGGERRSFHADELRERGDPTKAIIVTVGRDDESSDLVVTAKLRIDFFRRGTNARAGIGVCTDPNNGKGLNLVFHDGKLQWLHDFVAWGPGRVFPYEPGKWYWMKLSKSKGDPTAARWIDDGKEPGILKGKAWHNGEAEPADWMVLWSKHDDSIGGHPGLNGGSAGGASLLVRHFQGREGRAVGGEESPRPGQLDPERDLAGAPGTGWIALARPAWARIQSAKDGWISCQVPGEIHLDLIRAGQMPEPTHGVNMPSLSLARNQIMVVSNHVRIATDRLEYERQRLVFDGIDLYGQVFLNGKILGESANAFVPAEFDAKRLLRAGSNELVVRVTAGSELSRNPSREASEKIPNPTKRNWEAGRIWLRKPAFTYGWDWVDALPNIGIWRGVRLESRRHVLLTDLRLDTLRRPDGVFLEMEALLENIHARSERACLFELEIHPPGDGTAIYRRYPVDAIPGSPSASRASSKFRRPGCGGPTAWAISRCIVS